MTPYARDIAILAGLVVLIVALIAGLVLAAVRAVRAS